MFRSRRSTELGLLSLAGAFVLALAGLALPYLWNTAIAAARVGQPLLDSLRTTWIPLSGIVLDGFIAVLGLVGFGLLWRGRYELGSENASRAGLALLALLIAFVAYAAYALTGLVLGFVAGVEFLRPWHAAFALVGAVSLGASLYWVLAPMPVAGSRLAAAVSFALGVAGSALLYVATLGLRRAPLLTVEGAGFGLALASLVLWLILCVWDADRIRGRLAPAAPAAAARNG